MVDQLLHRFVTQLSQGVIIVQVDQSDRENRFPVHFINRAGCAVLGLLPADVEGQDFILKPPLPMALPLQALVEETLSLGREVAAEPYISEAGAIFKASAMPLSHDTVALVFDPYSKHDAGFGNADAPAFLRSVMEYAPIGLAFLDADYRYVGINRSMARMNGLPVEDHTGRTVRDVLGETAAIIEPPLAYVFGQGEAITGLELSATTPAQPGVERTWLNDFYPIYIDGVLRYVGAIGVEITERKRAELQLQASESRFRNTFDNAAVGIAHVGLNGKWLRVNQRLCDIVGYTPAELMQLDFQTIAHPDDLDADLEHFAALLRGDIESYQLEKRYLHREGHLVWVHLTVAMGQGETDTPRHCISVVQDITDRKMAEQRLQILADASKLLATSLDYEETLKHIADILVPELADWCSIDLLQPDGVIESAALANDDPAKVAWAAALRREEPLTLDSPSGVALPIRTGESLFTPHVTDEVLEAAPLSEEQRDRLRQLDLTSGMIVPLTIRGMAIGALTLLLAGGARRYDEADLQFAVELAQRMASAVDNARLFASVKQAEADLRAVNDNLAQRVAERTQELERSNRELQDFAYVASHDLQEPLRKIVAFSGRLQTKYGDNLDETAQDYIQRMQQAATRMQRLINDLLVLSRVTTRGQPFEPVDLNEVLTNVVDDLDAAIEESGARISVKPLPTVMADPSQMHQLFQNLVANAIKFRGEGQLPEIHVYPENEIDPASSREDGYRICVRDNGIGFDTAYLSRMFQPFQRLHGRDSFDGTGMGLAICRRIVERHGGSIEAVSAPGQGSTFVVILGSEAQPVDFLLPDRIA